MKVVGDGFGFGDEERLHTFGFDGDNVVLILQDAFDGEETFTGQQYTVLMKQVGRDDGVSHTSFIFKANKNKSFGSTRALAGDDAASDAQTLAVRNITQFDGSANTHGIEPPAAVGHGMRTNSQPGAVEVGDQTLFMVHGRQRGGQIGFRMVFKQRSGVAHGPFDLPKDIPAMER